MVMNKKGNSQDFFHRLDEIGKTIKRSYLYKLVSKFLSVICSIILVILLIIGGMMFFYKMQAKSYEKKGMEYTAPFGLYTIISPSMEPNVSVYDVVVAVESDVSKIKVGDVITFISTWDINYGVNVTHRVVAISKNENGEYQLTTKGDNNNTPDGSYVTQNNLIGKVVGRVPQLGRLQFFLATKMGWFIVVFIPALLIIIVDVIKIFRLYVLKSKIDSVKNPKDALREALGENTTEEVKTDANVVKPDVSVVSPTVVNPTVVSPKKETVPEIEIPIVASKQEEKKEDTLQELELPRIDESGKVKENTVPLPIVRSNEKIKEDLSNIEMPKPKTKDDISLPTLKSGESVKVGTTHKPLERRKLKRR